MFLLRLCMKRRHYLDHHSLLAPLRRDEASPSGRDAGLQSSSTRASCVSRVDRNTNREEGESRTRQLSPKFLREEFPPH